MADSDNIIKLGQYLRNSELSMQQIKRLKYCNDVIQQAAVLIYGANDFKNCTRILKIIKRNTGNISLLITQSITVETQLVHCTSQSCSQLSSDSLIEPNINLQKTIDVTNTSIDISAERSFDNINSSQIVPKGTNNIYPAKIRTNKLNFCCSVFEGEFTITVKEFSQIYDSNDKKFIRQVYPCFIKNKIKTVNNTCIINIKNCSYRKKYIIIYAYCSFATCKSFTLKCIPTSQLQVKVYSNSYDYSHEEQFTSQVRGIERLLLGNRLKTSTCLKVRTQDIKSSLEKMKETKNMGNIKSDAVYRKIKSNFASINDRCKDDIFDLILMQRENSNYIKKVCQPLQIYLYSREQLQILKYYTLFKKPILYLDATGSVIRKPDSQSKRIYYYSGVVPCINGRIIPIVDLVSSCHDTGSICSWLVEFKYFCIKNNCGWPVFNAVVVDFSFTLLNAISEAWNNMFLNDYCNYIFEMNNTTKIYSENFISIKLCCAHLFKLLARDINKFYESKHEKTVMKEIVASLFDIKNFSELSRNIESIFILTLKPSVTENVENALKDLCKTKCEVTNFKQECLKHENIKRNNLPNYKNNAYYIYFEKMYNKISKYGGKTENSIKNNTYYNPNFSLLFLQHYIPYLPLWTSIVHKRESNAYVENWFGVVKNNILEEKLHQKCSRFLRKLRNYVINQYRELQHNIKRTRCAIKRKLPYSIDEEIWNKKKKLKHTYFKRNVLQKMEREIYQNMKTNVEEKYVCNIPPWVDFDDSTITLPTRLESDYVVAKFKQQKLYYVSYDTLLPHKNTMDMWLDNFLIDYVFKIFESESKIKFLLSYEVTNIIYGHSVELYNHTTFYMPIWHNNHWMATLIDVKNESMEFFDPQHQNSRKALHFFNKINNYFNTNYKINLKLNKNYTYVCQNDSYNCGVFIIYYALQLITNNSLNIPMNIENFRKYIAYKIFSTSDLPAKNCLYCGESAGDLKCETCSKMIHRICTVRTEGINYKCDLCLKSSEEF